MPMFCLCHDNAMIMLYFLHKYEYKRYMIGSATGVNTEDKDTEDDDDDGN